MKRLPSLLGLYTFDVVARHLNFSKAARALHVTQGAVSHRIRGLEEELGATLLERNSRSVELTPKGAVLLRATEEAFERLRRGLIEMEAVGNPGRVTVSCSPSFAIRWLVPRLGRLRASVPDIEVYISAEDDLVRPGVGSVDVCIRFGPGGYQDVRAEQLSVETVAAVCSPMYLERFDLQKPADLERCTLLHDDVLADHRLHVGWEEWLEAAGQSALSTTDNQRFSHSHLALNAAAAGQGVALARRSLVETEVASGQLMAPFSVRVPSGLNYWLVTPTKMDEGSAASRFCTWLRHELGEKAG